MRAAAPALMGGSADDRKIGTIGGYVRSVEVAEGPIGAAGLAGRVRMVDEGPVPLLVDGEIAAAVAAVVCPGDPILVVGEITGDGCLRALRFGLGDLPRAARLLGRNPGRLRQPAPEPLDRSGIDPERLGMPVVHTIVELAVDPFLYEAANGIVFCPLRSVFEEYGLLPVSVFDDIAAVAVACLREGDRLVVFGSPEAGFLDAWMIGVNVVDVAGIEVVAGLDRAC